MADKAGARCTGWMLSRARLNYSPRREAAMVENRPVGSVTPAVFMFLG